MDLFDEYKEGGLPPDPATRTEDVEVICQAANADPKFRQFLERWLPRPSVSRKTVTAKDSVKAPSADDTSQRLLDKILQDSAVKSQERNCDIARLEIDQYMKLVSRAVEGHESYEVKRLQTQIEILHETSADEALPLHECEDIFNAVHFDIQTGNDVDIVRGVKHKTGLKESMRNMVERELVNLELQAANFSQAQQNDVMDEVQYLIKAEIVQNMQDKAASEKEIAQLRSKLVEPVALARESALRSVYFRLLSTLDELVPETSSVEELSRAQPGHDSRQSLSLEIDHAQDRLRQSIRKTKAIGQVTSSSASKTRSKDLLLKLKNLDIDKMHPTAALATTELDPLQIQWSTQDLLANFSQVRALENKLRHSRSKVHATELQASQAISSTLIGQAFAKRSMESPLLASQDLYSIQDLEHLSQAWKESSSHRVVGSEEAIRTKMQHISSDLRQVQKILDTTKQIMQDVQDYQSLQLDR